LVAKIFKDAAEACTQKVEKIVKEHRRVNQRYRDPHFDIDLDLKSRRGHCLGTWAEPTQWLLKDKSGKLYPNDNLPKSVKRVDVSGGVDDNWMMTKRAQKIFDKGKRTFLPGLASSGGYILYNVKHILTVIIADIIQGKVGNCWLMASLTALATIPKMIARICVAKDEGMSQPPHPYL
jgi:hypothetical protein